MQTGGAAPVGQVNLKKDRREETTNGGSIPGLPDSPVLNKPLPVSGQVPTSASPEVTPITRPPPQHSFRKPADVFDSKLYQPTKLSEKVFIPVKDYPKVGASDCMCTFHVYFMVLFCFILSWL